MNLNASAPVYPSNKWDRGSAPSVRSPRAQRGLKSAGNNEKDSQSIEIVQSNLEHLFLSKKTSPTKLGDFAVSAECVVSWPTIMINIIEASKFGLASDRFRIPDSIFFESSNSAAWITANNMNELSVRRGFKSIDVVKKFNSSASVRLQEQSQISPDRIVSGVILEYASNNRENNIRRKIYREELELMLVTDEIRKQSKTSFLQAYHVPLASCDDYVVCVYSAVLPQREVINGFRISALAAQLTYFLHSRTGLCPINLQKTEKSAYLYFIRQLVNWMFKQDNYFPTRIEAEFIVDINGALWLSNLPVIRGNYVSPKFGAVESIFDDQELGIINAEVDSLQVRNNIVQLENRCIECGVDLNMVNSTKYCWNCWADQKQSLSKNIIETRQPIDNNYFQYLNSIRRNPISAKSFIGLDFQIGSSDSNEIEIGTVINIGKQFDSVIALMKDSNRIKEFFPMTDVIWVDLALDRFVEVRILAEANDAIADAIVIDKNFDSATAESLSDIAEATFQRSRSIATREGDRWYTDTALFSHADQFLDETGELPAEDLLGNIPNMLSTFDSPTVMLAADQEILDKQFHVQTWVELLDHLKGVNLPNLLSCTKMDTSKRSTFNAFQVINSLVTEQRICLLDQLSDQSTVIADQTSEASPVLFSQDGVFKSLLSKEEYRHILESSSSAVLSYGHDLIAFLPSDCIVDNTIEIRRCIWTGKQLHDYTAMCFVDESGCILQDDYQLPPNSSTAASSIASLLQEIQSLLNILEFTGNGFKVIHSVFDFIVDSNGKNWLLCVPYTLFSIIRGRNASLPSELSWMDATNSDDRLDATVWSAASVNSANRVSDIHDINKASWLCLLNRMSSDGQVCIRVLNTATVAASGRCYCYSSSSGLLQQMDANSLTELRHFLCSPFISNDIYRHKTIPVTIFSLDLYCGQIISSDEFWNSFSNSSNKLHLLPKGIGFQSNVVRNSNFLRVIYSNEAIVCHWTNKLFPMMRSHQQSVDKPFDPTVWYDIYQQIKSTIRELKDFGQREGETIHSLEAYFVVDVSGNVWLVWIASLQATPIASAAIIQFNSNKKLFVSTKTILTSSAKSKLQYLSKYLLPNKINYYRNNVNYYHSCQSFPKQKWVWSKLLEEIVSKVDLPIQSVLQVYQCELQTSDSSVQSNLLIGYVPVERHNYFHLEDLQIDLYSIDLFLEKFGSDEDNAIVGAVMSVYGEPVLLLSLQDMRTAILSQLRGPVVDDDFVIQQVCSYQLLNQPNNNLVLLQLTCEYSREIYLRCEDQAGEEDVNLNSENISDHQNGASQLIFSLQCYNLFASSKLASCNSKSNVDPTRLYLDHFPIETRLVHHKLIRETIYLLESKLKQLNGCFIRKMELKFYIDQNSDLILANIPYAITESVRDLNQPEEDLNYTWQPLADEEDENENENDEDGIVYGSAGSDENQLEMEMHPIDGNPSAEETAVGTISEGTGSVLEDSFASVVRADLREQQFAGNSLSALDPIAEVGQLSGITGSNSLLIAANCNPIVEETHNDGSVKLPIIAPNTQMATTKATMTSIATQTSFVDNSEDPAMDRVVLPSIEQRPGSQSQSAMLRQPDSAALLQPRPSTATNNPVVVKEVDNVVNIPGAIDSTDDESDRSAITPRPATTSSRANTATVKVMSFIDIIVTSHKLKLPLGAILPLTIFISKGSPAIYYGVAPSGIIKKKKTISSIISVVKAAVAFPLNISTDSQESVNKIAILVADHEIQYLTLEESLNLLSSETPNFGSNPSTYFQLLTEAPSSWNLCEFNFDKADNSNNNARFGTIDPSTGQVTLYEQEKDQVDSVIATPTQEVIVNMINLILSTMTKHFRFAVCQLLVVFSSKTQGSIIEEGSGAEGASAFIPFVLTISPMFADSRPNSRAESTSNMRQSTAGASSRGTAHKSGSTQSSRHSAPVTSSRLATGQIRSSSGRMDSSASDTGTFEGLSETSLHRLLTASVHRRAATNMDFIELSQLFSQLQMPFSSTILNTYWYDKIGSQWISTFLDNDGIFQQKYLTSNQLLTIMTADSSWLFGFDDASSPTSFTLKRIDDEFGALLVANQFNEIDGRKNCIKCFKDEQNLNKYFVMKCECLVPGTTSSSVYSTIELFPNSNPQAKSRFPTAIEAFMKELMEMIIMNMNFQAKLLIKSLDISFVIAQGQERPWITSMQSTTVNLEKNSSVAFNGDSFDGDSFVSLNINQSQAEGESLSNSRPAFGFADDMTTQNQDEQMAATDVSDSESRSTTTSARTGSKSSKKSKPRPSMKYKDKEVTKSFATESDIEGSNSSAGIADQETISAINLGHEYKMTEVIYLISNHNIPLTNCLMSIFPGSETGMYILYFSGSAGVLRQKSNVNYEYISSKINSLLLKHGKSVVSFDVCHPDCSYHRIGWKDCEAVLTSHEFRDHGYFLQLRSVSIKRLSCEFKCVNSTPSPEGAEVDQLGVIYSTRNDDGSLSPLSAAELEQISQTTKNDLLNTCKTIRKEFIKELNIPLYRLVFDFFSVQTGLPLISSLWFDSFNLAATESSSESIVKRENNSNSGQIVQPKPKVRQSFAGKPPVQNGEATNQNRSEKQPVTVKESDSLGAKRAPASQQEEKSGDARSKLRPSFIGRQTTVNQNGESKSTKSPVRPSFVKPVNQTAPQPVAAQTSGTTQQSNAAKASVPVNQSTAQFDAQANAIETRATQQSNLPTSATASRDIEQTVASESSTAVNQMAPQPSDQVAGLPSQDPSTEKEQIGVVTKSSSSSIHMSEVAKPMVPGAAPEPEVKQMEHRDRSRLSFAGKSGAAAQEQTPVISSLTNALKEKEILEAIVEKPSTAKNVNSFDEMSASSLKQGSQDSEASRKALEMTSSIISSVVENVVKADSVAESQTIMAIANPSDTTAFAPSIFRDSVEVSKPSQQTPIQSSPNILPNNKVNDSEIIQPGGVSTVSSPKIPSNANEISSNPGNEGSYLPGRISSTSNFNLPTSAGSSQPVPVLNELPTAANSKPVSINGASDAVIAPISSASGPVPSSAPTSSLSAGQVNNPQTPFVALNTDEIVSNSEAAMRRASKKQKPRPTFSQKVSKITNSASSATSSSDRVIDMAEIMYVLSTYEIECGRCYMSIFPAELPDKFILYFAGNVGKIRQKSNVSIDYIASKVEALHARNLKFFTIDLWNQLGFIESVSTGEYKSKLMASAFRENGTYAQVRTAGNELWAYTLTNANIRNQRHSKFCRQFDDGKESDMQPDNDVSDHINTLAGNFEAGFHDNVQSKLSRISLYFYLSNSQNPTITYMQFETTQEQQSLVAEAQHLSDASKQSIGVVPVSTVNKSLEKISCYRSNVDLKEFYKLISHLRLQCIDCCLSVFASPSSSGQPTYDVFMIGSNNILRQKLNTSREYAYDKLHGLQTSVKQVVIDVLHSNGARKSITSEECKSMIFSDNNKNNEYCIQMLPSPTVRYRLTYQLGGTRLSEANLSCVDKRVENSWDAVTPIPRDLSSGFSVVTNWLANIVVAFYEKFSYSIEKIEIEVLCDKNYNAVLGNIELNGSSPFQDISSPIRAITAANRDIKSTESDILGSMTTPNLIRKPVMTQLQLQSKADERLTAMDFFAQMAELELQMCRCCMTVFGSGIPNKCILYLTTSSEVVRQKIVSNEFIANQVSQLWAKLNATGTEGKLLVCTFDGKTESIQPSQLGAYIADSSFQENATYLQIRSSDSPRWACQVVCATDSFPTTVFGRRLATGSIVSLQPTDELFALQSLQVDLQEIASRIIAEFRSRLSIILKEMVIDFFIGDESKAILCFFDGKYSSDLSLATTAVAATSATATAAPSAEQQTATYTNANVGEPSNRKEDEAAAVSKSTEDVDKADSLYCMSDLLSILYQNRIITKNLIISVTYSAPDYCIYLSSKEGKIRRKTTHLDFVVEQLTQVLSSFGDLGAVSLLSAQGSVSWMSYKQEDAVDSKGRNKIVKILTSKQFLAGKATLQICSDASEVRFACEVDNKDEVIKTIDLSGGRVKVEPDAANAIASSCCNEIKTYSRNLFTHFNDNLQLGLQYLAVEFYCNAEGPQLSQLLASTAPPSAHLVADELPVIEQFKQLLIPIGMTVEELDENAIVEAVHAMCDQRTQQQQRIQQGGAYLCAADLQAFAVRKNWQISDSGLMKLVSALDADRDGIISVRDVLLSLGIPITTPAIFSDLGMYISDAESARSGSLSASGRTKSSKMSTRLMTTAPLINAANDRLSFRSILAILCEKLVKTDLFLMAVFAYDSNRYVFFLPNAKEGTINARIGAHDYILKQVQKLIAKVGVDLVGAYHYNAVTSLVRAVPISEFGVVISNFAESASIQDEYMILRPKITSPTGTSVASERWRVQLSVSSASAIDTASASFQLMADNSAAAAKQISFRSATKAIAADTLRILYEELNELVAVLQATENSSIATITTEFYCDYGIIPKISFMSAATAIADNRERGSGAAVPATDSSLVGMDQLSDDSSYSYNSLKKFKSKKGKMKERPSYKLNAPVPLSSTGEHLRQVEMGELLFTLSTHKIVCGRFYVSIFAAEGSDAFIMYLAAESGVIRQKSVSLEIALQRIESYCSTRRQEGKRDASIFQFYPLGKCEPAELSSCREILTSSAFRELGCYLQLQSVGDVKWRGEFNVHDSNSLRFTRLREWDSKSITKEISLSDDLISEVRESIAAIIGDCKATNEWNIKDFVIDFYTDANGFGPPMIAYMHCNVIESNAQQTNEEQIPPTATGLVAIAEEPPKLPRFQWPSSFEMDAAVLFSKRYQCNVPHWFNVDWLQLACEIQQDQNPSLTPSTAARGRDQVRGSTYHRRIGMYESLYLLSASQLEVAKIPVSIFCQPSPQQQQPQQQQQQQPQQQQSKFVLLMTSNSSSYKIKVKADTDRKYVVSQLESISSKSTASSKGSDLILADLCTTPTSIRTPATLADCIRVFDQLQVGNDKPSFFVLQVRSYKTDRVMRCLFRCAQPGLTIDTSMSFAQRVEGTGELVNIPITELPKWVSYDTEIALRSALNKIVSTLKANYDLNLVQIEVDFLSRMKETVIELMFLSIQLTEAISISSHTQLEQLQSEKFDLRTDSLTNTLDELSFLSNPEGASTGDAAVAVTVAGETTAAVVNGAVAVAGSGAGNVVDDCCSIDDRATVYSDSDDSDAMSRFSRYSYRRLMLIAVKSRIVLALPTAPTIFFIREKPYNAIIRSSSNESNGFVINRAGATSSTVANEFLTPANSNEARVTNSKQFSNYLSKEKAIELLDEKDSPLRKSFDYMQLIGGPCSTATATAATAAASDPRYRKDWVCKMEISSGDSSSTVTPATFTFGSRDCCSGVAAYNTSGSTSNIAPPEHTQRFVTEKLSEIAASFRSVSDPTFSINFISLSLDFVLMPSSDQVLMTCLTGTSAKNTTKAASSGRGNYISNKKSNKVKIKRLDSIDDMPNEDDSDPFAEQRLYFGDILNLLCSKKTTLPANISGAAGAAAIGASFDIPFTCVNAEAADGDCVCFQSGAKSINRKRGASLRAAVEKLITTMGCSVEELRELPASTVVGTRFTHYGQRSEITTADMLAFLSNQAPLLRRDEYLQANADIRGKGSVVSWVCEVVPTLASSSFKDVGKTTFGVLSGDRSWQPIASSTALANELPQAQQQVIIDLCQLIGTACETKGIKCKRVVIEFDVVNSQSISQPPVAMQGLKMRFASAVLRGKLSVLFPADSGLEGNSVSTLALSGKQQSLSAKGVPTAQAPSVESNVSHAEKSYFVDAQRDKERDQNLSPTPVILTGRPQQVTFIDLLKSLSSRQVAIGATLPLCIRFDSGGRSLQGYSSTDQRTITLTRHITSSAVMDNLSNSEETVAGFIYYSDGHRRALLAKDCATYLSGDMVALHEKNSYFQVRPYSDSAETLICSYNLSNKALQVRHRQSDEETLIRQTNSNATDSDISSEVITKARTILDHLVQSLKEQLNVTVSYILAELALTGETTSSSLPHSYLLFTSMEVIVTIK